MRPEIQLVEPLAMERAAHYARRLRVSRRQFLMSSCGVATTLLCVNQVFGRGRKDVGGFFDVDPVAALDPQAAALKIKGSEFIFDIQTHHVNPDGAWRQTNRTFATFLRFFPQSSCGERDHVRCFSRDHYVRELFLDSDTTMAVLSAVPAAPSSNPLTAEEAAATREIVDLMHGSPRLIIHGLVLPNLPPLQTQLDGMQRLAEELRVKAWKVYTPWGPSGQGWRLDDPAVGIPFIERARQLGVKLICAHKGFPLPGFDARFAAPHDIGVVAKMFPDVQFLVYHSGYESSIQEGSYDPANATRGINALIKSLQDNGIPPNSNVYAELGTTWRSVMANPTEAAHVIGKLLRFVGEDRVVWGTDSIWYGSPQDQIEAFRAFQISESFQEQFGYPALTPQIKAKVFGLNAASAYGINPTEVRRQIRGDMVEQMKLAYQENPQPSFETYGPRTRREFFRWRRVHGDQP
jgi:hypothetical protein